MCVCVCVCVCACLLLDQLLSKQEELSIAKQVSTLVRLEVYLFSPHDCNWPAVKNATYTVTHLLLFERDMGYSHTKLNAVCAKLQQLPNFFGIADSCQCQ